MVRRLLKLARAPAGNVKRKNGNEAAVAISDSNSGEAPNAFISHVAAVSWAATQTPETTPGNHSPTKAGFLTASQMEVVCFGSLITRKQLTCPSRHPKGLPKHVACQPFMARYLCLSIKFLRIE